jgi:hypothetical protein
LPAPGSASLRLSWRPILLFGLIFGPEPVVAQPGPDQSANHAWGRPSALFLRAQVAPQGGQSSDTHRSNKSMIPT